LPSPDLGALKRADSERKRRAVLDALAQMQAAGMPITFRSVARRAGVSHWLAYQEPLRSAIERARTQTPAEPPVSPADGQLTALAAQVRSLLDRNALLERRLTEAVAPVVANPDETTSLRNRVIELRRERDALARKVQQLQDDLDGAQDALRQMMIQVNR
jgi:FtsZ-binding cell division protein ZapB